MTKNETWQQTKHGLYKRFNFINFAEAFSFMTDVAAIAEEQQHHPRWENEWSVVQIWLMTHEESSTITDKDYALADAIDRLVQTKSDSEHSNGRKFEELKLYTDGGCGATRVHLRVVLCCRMNLVKWLKRAGNT